MAACGKDSGPAKLLNFLEGKLADSPDSAFHTLLDREILHSETRIKFWVVAGVLANLVILIGIGAPLIYYLGTIQSQANSAMVTIQATSVKLQEVEERVNRHELWESAAETWMNQQGFVAPRQREGNSK